MATLRPSRLLSNMIPPKLYVNKKKNQKKSAKFFLHCVFYQ